MNDLFSNYGTHLKLAVVVFVGLHVPLVMSGIVWLGKGHSDPQSLMLSVLLGTVGGLVISVSGIWTVLKTQATATA